MDAVHLSRTTTWSSLQAWLESPLLIQQLQPILPHIFRTDGETWIWFGSCLWSRFVLESQLSQCVPMPCATLSSPGRGEEWYNLMGASFGPSWGCVTRAWESEPNPPELPRIFKCWALLFVNRLKTVVETLFGWQVNSSCLCSPPAWLLLGGFFGGMVCGLVFFFFSWALLGRIWLSFLHSLGVCECTFFF